PRDGAGRRRVRDHAQRDDPLPLRRRPGPDRPADDPPARDHLRGGVLEMAPRLAADRRARGAGDVLARAACGVGLRMVLGRRMVLDAMSKSVSAVYDAKNHVLRLAEPLEGVENHAKVSVFISPDPSRPWMALENIMT